MIHSLRTHHISPRKLHRAQKHYCPAIIELRGTRFIVYRCQNSLTSPSWLAISMLDDRYRVKWTKRLQIASETGEDPRACVVDDQVYVFYQTGCSHWPKIGIGDWTVRVAKYDDSFEPIYDKPLKWVRRQQCEKNWCPFFDQIRQKWYCIYSANPWRVLEFDGDWVADLAYEGKGVKWEWGELRGGTCPVRVLPPIGRFGFGMLSAHYWAFMHSAFDPHKVTKSPRQYVGGLISFDSEYPFKPTGISARPVLWPDPAARTAVAAQVAYPGGAMLSNGLWRVSYGEGDAACRIAEFRHDELIDGINFRKLG